MWISHTSPADRACYQRYKCGGGWWTTDEKHDSVEFTLMSKEDRQKLEAEWAVCDRQWDEELTKAGGDTAKALRNYLVRRRNHWRIAGGQAV